ncbi:MAG: hypothetical protein HY092_00855 [Candidatus Kerfeldbacteria bacterium]|nr:hypothetical protein [Candidatus Kerfeldbacteria bacterium]
MTGPLMSSRESYNERRNELIHDIEDQIQHGVYRTSTVEAKAPDPITGETKSIQVVKITTDATGNQARQEQSPLERFGIQTFNLSLNSLDYEETVEKQIRQQQEMTMAVQTAIAEARKAEQAAITAAKNGEAEAAKAKWAQEVVKAKEVTLAQQHLAVNTLEAQAAEQRKRQLILEGEGEGEKKRLAMVANGALEQKLATYLETQKVWAGAFERFQGQLVPGVVMGGGANAAPASGVQNFMDLMSVKAARDLNLDMSLPAGAQAARKSGK